MISKKLLIPFFLICSFTAACSTSDLIDPEQEEMAPPNEKIYLTINESVEYRFEKYNNTWSGNKVIYGFSANDEKVIESRYVTAGDSSWKDFDLFVNFLQLYELPPQHEIEGWVPDSGKLPKRVYTFEVFDGNETREYSYQDPENGIRDYWQFQKVMMFVTFVEDELHWMNSTS